MTGSARAPNRAKDARSRRSNLKALGDNTALLDQLFRQPYVTAATAAELLGVTDPTARSVIGRLEEAGLLREITGGSWGRVYEARPILEVLERPLPGKG